MRGDIWPPGGARAGGGGRGAGGGPARVCGYRSVGEGGGYLAAGDVAGGGKLFARGIVDRDFALCGGCYGVGDKTGNLSSIDTNAQRIGIVARKLQAVYQRYDRLSYSQILRRAKRAVWISSQKPN